MESPNIAVLGVKEVKWIAMGYFQAATAKCSVLEMINSNTEQGVAQAIGGYYVRLDWIIANKINHISRENPIT